MKTQLPYILFVLLLISCGGNRNTGAEVETELVAETDFFVFDLEAGIAEGPKATTLNELIDSISFIPLETHKDLLLPGGLYKFRKIGGNMFICGGGFFVNQKPSPLYQFDSLGRFVKRAIHIGRGPNEVIEIWSLDANANLKQIYAVDVASKTVIISTDSGEKSTVNTSLGGVPLNDSTFVSAQSLGYGDIPNTYLYFRDRAGNLVHAIERHDELSNYNTASSSSEYAQAPPYEQYRLFSDYKGDAIFHDIFNDTLYRIKNRSEITPHLVFKRGRLSPRHKDTFNAESKKKQVYFISVIESGDYVFLNYFHGDLILWSDIWSKRDGSLLIHTAPKRRGANDIFLPYALPDGSVTELTVVYADRDNVYCILEALDACKFLPGIKEDDNPVIVIAKLKK